MKKNNPNADTLKIVNRILGEVKEDGRLSFTQVMEKFYEKSWELLPPEIEKKMFNLSPGTSRVKAFPVYLKALSRDISKHRYYREYSSPQGEFYVRRVISDFENLKLSSSTLFQPGDICITEGATGAVSQIFEYFKKAFPEGEVLIPVPSYYIFVFTAKYYGIPFCEVIPTKKPANNKPFFTADDIINSISDKTRMIVLNHPHNPTGYVFTDAEIIKILKVAKQKNILILADELFYDLIFNQNHKFHTVSELASREDLLDQVVTVKAYSKNRNLPGFRIGYLFTKNKPLLNYVSMSQEQRVFFAAGSNFRSIIILDCFFQTVSHFLKSMPQISVTDSIHKAKELYSYADDIKILSVQKILNLYQQFIDYTNNTCQFYSQNYDLIIETLGKDLDVILPKQSAFNTFIKVKGLDGVNIFDFTLNLYLATGIMSDTSPCFGLKQSIWESNPSLGYWVRITYSAKPNNLKRGLKILKNFKNKYLLHPEQFIHTNLQF